MSAFVDEQDVVSLVDQEEPAAGKVSDRGAAVTVKADAQGLVRFSLIIAGAEGQSVIGAGRDIFARQSAEAFGQGAGGLGERMPREHLGAFCLGRVLVRGVEGFVVHREKPDQQSDQEDRDDSNCDQHKNHLRPV